jgi:sigma-B regulation protein RsbU (phosphoserine phosphatase)
MNLLIADDDEVARMLIVSLLRRRGYRIDAVGEGRAAWDRLMHRDAPKIALLDWMMPGIDGIEICRGIRALPNRNNLYLILLTSRDGHEHVVEGLSAGANDYITKPFHPEELLARVNIGVQTVQLQMELTHRVRELEDALSKVKQLQGLLPICSYCKSIRDDKNYWQRVEDYLGTHSGAECSHGICPKCWETVVRSQFAEAGIPMPSERVPSPVLSHQ